MSVLQGLVKRIDMLNCIMYTEHSLGRQYF